MPPYLVVEFGFEERPWQDSNLRPDAYYTSLYPAELQGQKEGPARNRTALLTGVASPAPAPAGKPGL